VNADAARIEPLLPPGWQRRPRSSRQIRVGLLEEDNDVYSIYSDGICTHDSPGKEYALMMMEAQIQAHFALDAPGLIFVHAGAVADGDRAILIPGLSFSGKTTLVRALVQAGAVYYSDEYAVLDETGRVRPYARPLSFRPPEGRPVNLRVEEMGGIAGTEPLPVGMVIVTRYRPGAEWQPQRLTPGEAAHTVPAQTRPEQAMRALGKAADGAVALQGERGEADEFAAMVLEALRAAA